jgi:hypothetical protein
MICALALVLINTNAASGQEKIKPPTNAPAPLKADEPEDESRQIYFEYAGSRPKKAAPASGKSAPAKSARRYLRKTPKVVAAGLSVKDAKAPQQPQSIELAQIGVTVWKLRPSTAKDEKETRILDQEETDERVELTPVRIEADAPLKVKDKVRLSVESPRTGYLYVVDRELYADGTMSAPYLIFPTLRTRGGDNKVSAGVLVDIPAQNEPPFTMKPSRPDQVGEVLTILVSPQQLDVPPLQRKYMRLDEAQVRQWERDWKTEAERFEMVGGAGQAWTKEEKAAGAGGTRILAQDDPAPQTIYRVATKPGSPLMITVPLRYASAEASSEKAVQPKPSSK